MAVIFVQIERFSTKTQCEVNFLAKIKQKSGKVEFGHLQSECSLSLANLAKALSEFQCLFVTVLVICTFHHKLCPVLLRRIGIHTVLCSARCGWITHSHIAAEMILQIDIVS